MQNDDAGSNDGSSPSEHIASSRVLGTFDLEAVLQTKADEGYRTEGSPADLCWSVTPAHENEHEAYCIDLGRLAYGPEHRNAVVSYKRSAIESRTAKMRVVVKNAALTFFLSKSIKEWSSDKSKRTASESLSIIKLFYIFFSQITNQLGSAQPQISIDPILALGQATGLAFSEWLRHRRISASRRSIAYATAKQFIEKAIGRTVWRAGPFYRDTRILTGTGDHEIPISCEQFRALLKMCRSVTEKFREDRVHLIREKALNEASRASYQTLKKLMRHGASAIPPDLVKMASQLYGTEDVICASFLLSLIRLGCNEQPLLDATRQWNAPNPHDRMQRVIYLWKKRAKTARKRWDVKPPKSKRIALSSAIRPRNHPYRVMRYVERITQPLRHFIAAQELSGLKDSQARHQKYLAIRFWIFISDDGEIRDLSGPSMYRKINNFIERRANAFAELRTPAGDILRYSAKALRNSYLEFVQRLTGFDIESGQLALSHGPDSGAIQNYLRKSWARKYVRSEHRLMQDEMLRLFSQPDWELNPVALRTGISQARGRARELRAVVSAPPRYRSAQVRDGLFCVDQLHPPESVYVPKREGEACPAEKCLDCHWARLFDASLPGIASSICHLESQRDHGPLHLWEGSDAAQRLHKLRDLLSRFPPSKREAAMTMAKNNSAPILFFKTESK